MWRIGSGTRVGLIVTVLSAVWVTHTEAIFQVESVTGTKVTNETKITLTIDLPDTLHCIFTRQDEENREKCSELTTHRGQHQWVHHQGSLPLQSKCDLLVRPEGQSEEHQAKILPRPQPGL